MRLLEATPYNVPVSQFVRLSELEAFNTYRSEKEITLLKEQIQADGFIRDCVVVWVRESAQGQELVLVDGFNRHNIATQLEFETLRAYFYEFRDMEEVRYWIQLNQQARRNLTELQRSYFTGVILNEVAEDRERLYSFLLAKGMEDIVRALQGTTSSRVNIFEWLSEPLGSTEATLRRNASLARVIDKVRSLNKELAASILSGEVVLRSGEIQEVSMRQLLDVDKGMKRWPGVLADWEALLQAVVQRKERTLKEGQSGELTAVKTSYKKFLKEPSESLLKEITVHLRAYLKVKESVEQAA